MPSKFITIIFFIILTACSSYRGHNLNSLFSSDKTQKATAILVPQTADSKIKGKVTLTQHNKKIILIAEISGLEPETEHGFHILEAKDCAAENKGHFNPYGNKHGHMSSDSHHIGDIINLNSDQDGNAYYQIVIEDINLSEGKLGVLNRAVAINLNPDNYESQPDGNSGKLIACGLIKKN